MKKPLFLSLVIILTAFTTCLAFGDANIPAKEKGIDWVEIIFAGGYLVGVFILLPIVVYTNLKEKLFVNGTDAKNEILSMEKLNDDEKNSRASMILEKIEEKLTHYKDESGIDMVTITKGSQAKFMKRGLDYINKILIPTDEDVIARVNEFTDVYNNRTKRAFTGSYWIIACSAGVGLLLLFTAGLSTFIFIHFLGLLFYILSSRTTMYGIEKRMGIFGRAGGVIGSILTALFLAEGTKYYVKEGSGPWKRDWETEGQMAMIGLIIMIVVALILGFLAAFLGVVNFLINYSTSFLIPAKNEVRWYEDNFSPISA